MCGGDAFSILFPFAILLPLSVFAPRKQHSQQQQRSISGRFPGQPGEASIMAPLWILGQQQNVSILDFTGDVHMWSYKTD